MYRRTNVLYRVVDALFRNRNMVLITILCVAIPVALLLIFRSQGYTATAAVSVAQEAKILRGKMGADLDQAGWKTASDVNVAQLNTLLRDVKQGGFVDDVFQRAALNPPVSLAPGVNDKRVEKFLGAISARADGDNLFTISLNWDESDECKKLVQAVQEQYIAAQALTNQQSSTNRADILKEQLTRAETLVQQAMVAREQFRKKHPEVGPDTHNVLIDRIGYLEERLRRAKLMIVEGGERISQVAPRIRSENKYITTDTSPLVVLGDSPALKRLNDLQDRRSQITAGEGAMRKDSDAVRALDRQIDQAQLAVAKERREKQRNGGTSKRELNPRYSALIDEASQSKLTAKTAQLEITDLTAQLAMENQKLRNLPALQKEMENYDLKVNQEQNHRGKLSDAYTSAEQQASMEKKEASQTLKTVGEVFAVSLAGPKKRITLGLVSLILGAIVAALMVALREWSDPTIRYETDIEQALDIPVLTGLPETRAVLSGKSIGGKPRRRGAPKGLLSPHDS